MPLRRRIINLGHSKAITIPSDWLEEHERRTGRKIDSMLMEVNNVIVLAVPEEISPAVKPPKESESQLPKKTTEITVPLSRAKNI